MRKRILFFIVGLPLVISLAGCEAFVRKFTRKPKKDGVREELVLSPEEYVAPKKTTEELYRDSFLYWKSWHDELLSSLVKDGNHKKQRDCIQEALKNLDQMRALLKPAKQQGLDIYISQMKSLQEAISRDSYGMNVLMNAANADRIRKSILKNFSFPGIKEGLA
jgi:hypothetical protein